MIRKVLIDDEYWALKGLEQIIDWAALNFRIVGSYNTPQEALEKIKNGLTCDLVLTDIRMPEMSGLDMITEIKRFCPNVYFVLISGYAEFTYAQQALRLQISDYILKPVDKSELIKVLEKVKETKEQKSLTKKERESNLKGCFAARKADCEGRTFIIVDDVMTTGATAGEAARILKRKGAKKVYIATMASVEYKREV